MKSIKHLHDSFVFFGHVLVAPSPDIRVVMVVFSVPGRRVTSGPQRSFHYQVRVGGLQVIRQSESGAQVYERCAEVHPVIAQLGRLVVPRECVMVVMPSLAERQDCNRRVLRRRNIPADRQSARGVKTIVYR